MNADPQTTFATLWSEALRHFQQNADVSSARWKSLIQRMSLCNDVEEVSAVLDETMQKTKGFSKGGVVWRDLRTKYLRPLIRVMLSLNEAIAEIASYFPVVPGGKAIFVALGILLEATNGLGERCEALVSLLEELNLFLESLHVRLDVPSKLGSASKTIAITILAHLLEVILIATKLLSQPAWRARLKLYRQALVKDKKIANALERLRVLTNLEARAITAETHAAVADLHVVISQLASQVDIMKRELRTFSRDESDASGILEKLSWVDAADIDAQDVHGCLQGTRANLLTALRSWSIDDDAPRVYWLNGMAGTGKSAIARSLCRDLLRLGRLGGSFFCSRTASVAQADVLRIIPTLAGSLALHDFDFRAELLASLRRRPFNEHCNLEIQIQRLLKEPLAHVQSDYSTLPVFVLDALDECADENGTSDLLTRLVKEARDLPVKFFITSRPEPQIRQNLEVLDPEIGQILRLHDVEQDSVAQDISLYLNHELLVMRETISPFLSNWPRKADVSALTRMSGRLFIYAFTALMYIRKNPVDRLAKLTSTIGTAGRALTQNLDDIYDLVLTEAMNLDEYEVDEIDLTRRIIAIIISLREPLTVTGLAQLLRMPTYRLRCALNKLYAVIYVPVRDDIGLLSTFHASFVDFLTTEGRTPTYMTRYIHDGRSQLAQACVDFIQSERLCFNVSRAGTSYLPNSKQELAHIDGSLRYACLHWSHHIETDIGSGRLTRTLPALEKAFMGPKFLFWLDALSAMGLSHEAYKTLMIMHDVRFVLSPPFAAFIVDAITFVLNFSHVIAHSAPHVYLSALAACPEKSAIARYCMPFFPNLARFSPIAALSQRSLWPTSAAFSPDGTQIAVGYDDGTLLVWNLPDINSSDASFVFGSASHTNSITCIVFSPDGKQIATGSDDSTVCVWNVVRCQGIRRYVGHVGKICAVTYSPDGSRFASSSEDCTVRLWDAATGRDLGPPMLVVTDYSLTNVQIPAIAFSPDGRLLATGSSDCKVRIWETESGMAIGDPILCHTGRISCVTFSSDGHRILSGAYNGTVCVSDVETRVLISRYTILRCGEHWLCSSVHDTGSAVGVVHGTTDSVILFPCTAHPDNPDSVVHTLREKHSDRSMSFSVESAQVAIGSDDFGVRVLDLAQNSAVRPPLHGHTGDVRFVKFSHDGHRIVSCAFDNTIRIWNWNDMNEDDNRQTCTFGPDKTLAMRFQAGIHSTCTSLPESASSKSSNQAHYRLNDDGWIEDVSYDPPHLILWVPPEKRKGLYIPPMSLIIAPHETWSLDLSHFARGAQWTESFASMDRINARMLDRYNS